MAWVAVAPAAGESAADGRRRRRVELARGWRFKCECARCLGEALEDVAREDEDRALGVRADESRVEAVVRHEGVKAGAGGDAMGPD